MVAQAGATVDFPLAAKFHAVALRIALAPDQPTSAQAVVRILADGRLIYSAPAMKVGDDPRFIEVSVQSPQTITLTADSPFPDTKVLFIDPVVIR